MIESFSLVEISTDSDENDERNPAGFRRPKEKEQEKLGEMSLFEHTR